MNPTTDKHAAPAPLVVAVAKNTSVYYGTFEARSEHFGRSSVGVDMLATKVGTGSTWYLEGSGVRIGFVTTCFNNDRF